MRVLIHQDKIRVLWLGDCSGQLEAGCPKLFGLDLYRSPARLIRATEEVISEISMGREGEYNIPAKLIGHEGAGSIPMVAGPIIWASPYGGRVENVAGKIQFLPGNDATTIEGEAFSPSFVTSGSFDLSVWVGHSRYDINLFLLRKTELEDGNAGWTSGGSLVLPPGVTTISVYGTNARGRAQDVIRVNVLPRKK